MTGFVGIESLHKTGLDRRVEKESDEVHSVFQSQSGKLLGYRQFALSDGCDQSLLISCYLSPTCWVLAGYLRGACGGISRDGKVGLDSPLLRGMNVEVSVPEVPLLSEQQILEETLKIHRRIVNSLLF